MRRANYVRASGEAMSGESVLIESGTQAADARNCGVARSDPHGVHSVDTGDVRRSGRNVIYHNQPEWPDVIDDFAGIALAIVLTLLQVLWKRTPNPAASEK